MYCFHLTIDVRRGYHEQYQAYKLAATRISADAPGHLWSAVVHADQPRDNLYYHLSGWESEQALDAAGSSRRNEALKTDTHPHDMLNSSPAFREPSLLIGAPPAATSEGGQAPECLHRIYRVASNSSAVAAKLRDSVAGCATTSHTHVILQVIADPAKVYELIIGSCAAQVSVDHSPLAEPVQQVTCRILALLPAGSMPAG